MAGAGSKNCVTPLADPFCSTTVPWTVPNPFKVTILISCFSTLTPISYTNYHKTLCMSKSRSNRYYGAIAVPVYYVLHTNRLALFSSSDVSLCHHVFMAPELFRNARLPFQGSAFSLLFSLHILSLRGFISIYGYMTAIVVVLRFLSPSEPLFQVPDTYSNCLLDHLHLEVDLEKPEKWQEVVTWGNSPLLLIYLFPRHNMSLCLVNVMASELELLRFPSPLPPYLCTLWGTRTAILRLPCN